MVRLYELSIKLKMNEFYNTSGVSLNIPADESYSDEVIEKAKQVKAKHIEEQKKAAEKGVQLDLYSDSWYLEFATSLKKQYLQGRSKEIYDKSILGCPVKDPQWAGYSYDEILEMENNGIEIPQEVIQWAHAQQQTDVTDYVMIAEGTTTEDTSASTEEVTNDTDLNSLQKKAKQYIIQSENAREEIEVQYSQHQKKANNAKKIQKQKEDTYQDSMNELTERTKEWQELNEKKKQGEHLTFKERIRFKFLSKILDTSNGTLLKEVQADQNNLDDFLESLDAINIKNDENITLGQETVKAGEDLSSYGKTFNEETHETTGVVNNDMGLTGSETLNNIPEDDIAKIAIDTGKDLEEYADTISSDLSSEENVNLSEFAQDYSELAGQTIEKVEQKENSEEDDNEEENDKNNNEFKGYSVSKSFTWQNSIVASATTTKAMNEALNQQTSVLSYVQKAAKDLKNAEKDIKNLSSETEKTADKHESNIQQETEILQELEELESNNTPKDETQQIPDEKVKTTDNKTETPKTSQTETQEEDITGEKQSKISEIETITTQDEQDMSTVKNVASKNAVANAKYQKTAKLLNTENDNLDKRSSNLKEVATDTIIVGTGTTAKSIITTAIGMNQVTTGDVLMASPFTFSQGVYFTALGVANIIQGTKEAVFGTEAIVTGAEGLSVNKEADENVSDASTTNKNLVAAIKLSNQKIKESGAGVETQDTTDTQGTQETSSEQTTGTQEPVNNSETTDEQTNITSSEEGIENPDQADITAEPLETETTTESEETEPTVEQEETTEETEPVANNAETQETQGAEGTDKTDETTEQDQENEETEQSSNSNNNSGYDVSLDFSAQNSIAATQTTNQATSEMILAASGIDKSATSVIQQTKKTDDIVKTINKDAKQAKEEQENNNEQIQNITTEITNAQAEVQNASSTQEAQTAQDKVETLSTELESSTTDNAQNSMDKSVLNSVKQLLQFKKDTQNLGAENTSLNSIISNQLKVSEKTLAVGIGTDVLGIKDTIFGNTKIANGIALMASPFTYSAGLNLTINGGLQLAKGIYEIETGTIAAATGVSGIVSNAAAKESAQDAESAKKDAETKYKDANKEIQDNVKLVEENEQVQDQTTTPTEEETEIPQQEEEEEIDETLLAGSASANVSVTSSTETDDKADKKLTRFNTDSIIESKKKQKKVQAVKASSKN